MSAFKIRDLEATQSPWEPTASEFDLVLMIVNKAQGLGLALLYDSSIFDDSTIGRMLGQIETLLEEFIKKPEARLCELSLLIVGGASAHPPGMEPDQSSGSVFCRYPCPHRGTG